MSSEITTMAMARETLPAFLRQRDGQLEMVIHCTWAQDHMICPRKFWLYYGEQVESTEPRVALNYGGAIHAALAYRYTHLGLSVNSYNAEQSQLLQAWFDRQPQPGDEWRNAGRAQELNQAYNEWVHSGETAGEAGGGWSASAPGLEDFQVLGVEEEFEVRVGEIESSGVTGVSINKDGERMVHAQIGKAHSVPIYLAGRKDLVVAWNDGLWVMDHKTSTDWGSGESNKQLDEGRRSFQFRGYAWAEREEQRLAQSKLSELHGGFCRGCGNPIDPEVCHCGDYVKDHGVGSGHGPVPMGCTCGYADQSQFPKPSPRLVAPILGTIGNYLVSRKPYVRPPAPGKAAIPRNQFHRESYPFSGEVLDEWREECLDLAREILANWQRGRWPVRNTGCGHWGRCEFYDYCEASGADRQAMLQSSMFRSKDFDGEL